MGDFAVPFCNGQELWIEAPVFAKFPAYSRVHDMRGSCVMHVGVDMGLVLGSSPGSPIFCAASLCCPRPFLCGAGLQLLSAAVVVGGRPHHATVVKSGCHARARQEQ